MPQRPKVYFSFRSPYSWLALDTLKGLGLRECFDYVPLWEPGDVVACALELEGAHLLYDQMSRSKHLYILQDVKRLVAARQEPMIWPIDHDPEWDLPHLAWLACRRLGTEWEFYDLVVDLRWTNGIDVCVEEYLRPAMDKCGLEGISLCDLRADPQVVSDAVAALKDTYENDVFGMPYFTGSGDSTALTHSSCTSA